MRDTTLDTFRTEADRDDGERDAAGEAVTDAVSNGDTDGNGDTTTAAEPAVSTADWTPGGAPCEACSGVVEWRWRDAGRLVCEECKEW